MPDHRKHRGPHPEDRVLFAEDQLVSLRDATADLSWLFSRGYVAPSAVKLVGDRYSLTTRQRLAISRCACSEEARKVRKFARVETAEIGAREIWIDGFNVLTSVEAALSGGVMLIARDGTLRDMASMHGNYRRVDETAAAINLIGETLQQLGAGSCQWFLDRPVSNSGRLKTMLGEIAAQRGWDWIVDVVADPDSLLSDTDQVVATSDSQILDRAPNSLNLVRYIVERRIPNAWLVDLSCGRSIGVE